MTLLAHSARNRRPTQSYYEHVTGVVGRACQNVNVFFPFVDMDRMGCYIRIVKEAATYHDLGKLAILNQDVLAKKSNQSTFLLNIGMQA